jgi:ribosome maturation factor RimP
MSVYLKLIARGDNMDRIIYELTQTLIFKMYNGIEATISYFENGYLKNINGYIQKVDRDNAYMQINDGRELFKIFIANISKVD